MKPGSLTTPIRWRINTLEHELWPDKTADWYNHTDCSRCTFPGLVALAQAGVTLASATPTDASS